MSRLRELRLHGFKTFADPTRFVFEPGVNAVIGPNGSGKSNMADAVRWVLGEQSNRSLRTRRADDVIFAGSQQRKPQGMAEAILTLDNADGWLPIEFNEVSIGRRAYRSGESEYLINGARARLRDVVELLGEGRLGANELVVVGQGTVDSALSLRPEERRQLFEEAAGVKNLQVRKNEALARLGRARDNLTRVTDLIARAQAAGPAPWTAGPACPGARLAGHPGAGAGARGAPSTGVRPSARRWAMLGAVRRQPRRHWRSTVRRPTPTAARSPRPRRPTGGPMRRRARQRSAMAQRARRWFGPSRPSMAPPGVSTRRRPRFGPPRRSFPSTTRVRRRSPRRVPMTP